MKNRWITRSLLALPIIIGLLAISTIALAKEVAQQWDLVNPEGVIEIKTMELAPRITSLEDKTIVLRWNGKHNGNNFLDRVAELLAQQVRAKKVIKFYETDPATNVISGSYAASAEIAKKIAALKPDIVIASQCD
jgi:hypothetical protein